MECIWGEQPTWYPAIWDQPRPIQSDLGWRACRERDRLNSGNTENFSRPDLSISTRSRFRSRNMPEVTMHSSQSLHHFLDENRVVISLS